MALYDLAAAIRGPILDQLVFIDIALIDYLSDYFATEDDRRSALAADVIVGMNLERKIDLFSGYLRPTDPDLVADLRALKGLRNDLAHGTPDTSDAALGVFEASGDITFMVRTRKGHKERRISAELAKQHARLCNRCVEAIAVARDALGRNVS